ncbi:interleukin-18 receptor 1-like [Solea solea]|uniref:interleukin-18 receptor 1-like n=1 Tax=Solea solea TaxID=90069 RepID=UPI00272B1EEB|nr:interleukin-18 receptor 1-like [Solea solea]
MAMKMLLAVRLLLLLTLQPGVISRKSREISVKAGEMVALQCPYYRNWKQGGSTVTWTSHTAQREYVINKVSRSELKQMGVLLNRRSLVILSATANHQGTYSCSLGNDNRRQFWFNVSVNPAQSRNMFSQTCRAQESCKLSCPDVNVPAVKTRSMSSKGIIWHKEGELLQNHGYLPSVEENDRGVYTCTRSYLHRGQIYNMTFTVALDVHPKKQEKAAAIISPHNHDVVFVELGSPAEVLCEAVMYSDFDDIFWLSGKSVVQRNPELPFSSNYKWESKGEEVNMTASLFFKNVSEDDLKRNYTCKLESVSQTSSFVTVTLAKKGLNLSWKVLEKSLNLMSTKVWEPCKKINCSSCHSFTGTCYWRSNICVKVGEMVTLDCPPTANYNGDLKVVWTSYSPQEVDLTSMARAEQRHKGVLVHGRSLIILSASAEHHGNYSCSLGNASSHFLVTVSRLCNMSIYNDSCKLTDYCKFNCPDVNVPAINTPNITYNGIMWRKGNWSLPNYDKLTFSAFEEKDAGIYTCTRSYLHHGQIYNMTFTVPLDVKPQSDDKPAAIVSPRENEVFLVNLGSNMEIECKAVINSEFDGLCWIINGNSAVKENAGLPVFVKRTNTNNSDKIALLSLVFKKVSEGDLTQNYSCKLETANQYSTSVTIRLQNVRPSWVPLAVNTVGIAVVMTAAVLLYVKFKIYITLFLRDTLGCHRGVSDGKSYDAFVMCYKSNTDAGLNADDRRWLEIVLEEEFGYRLCLHDRDIQLGKAVANAVLECIEESRTVVLVPTSLDPGLGSGLLSAVHEALVERQTRLIFIKSETTKEMTSGSLPEALQLLSEAGDGVTWRGRSSSSSFLKRLRFYLPASPKELQIRLLQTSRTELPKTSQV